MVALWLSLEGRVMSQNYLRLSQKQLRMIQDLKSLSMSGIFQAVRSMGLSWRV